MPSYNDPIIGFECQPILFLFHFHLLHVALNSSIQSNVSILHAAAVLSVFHSLFQWRDICDPLPQNPEHVGNVTF